jgi:hypothetical protein
MDDREYLRHHKFLLSQKEIDIVFYSFNLVAHQSCDVINGILLIK